MSKAKNKYKYWCSKQQYKHIMNYPELLGSDIQLYQISTELKFYKSIKPDKIHSIQTLELFNANKKNYEFLNKIKKSIQAISKHDIVFTLHGKNYLFHTYKILGFIEDSWSALLLSKDKEFQKGTIGNYDKGEKDFYFNEYNDNRKQLCKANNPMKGINLLNAFLYRNFHQNKDFTRYFLSYFALFGINNIKLLNNDNLESKIIKNTLKVFQSGKITVKDCAKSLLSILYYYFVYKMKINKNNALSLAQDLVYHVFKECPKYKGSELIRNVYVKEVIGSHIIYSFDTKKEHISKKNKIYLEKVISETMLDTQKFPLQLIQPSLKNPLQLYSLLTPSELLQKI